MRLILNYFIAGMIFVSIVSPLLEEIATVIVQGLQIVVGYFKIVVSKQSLEITKIKAETEKVLQNTPTARTIGFAANSEEEEE